MSFRLRKHGVVIAQSDTTVRPKPGSSESAFEALRSLSRLTVFTLYLRKDSLDDRKLKALCTLTDGNWQLTAGELESLYGGKGATSIPDADIAAEGPPSYDELALTPPPPLPLDHPSDPSSPGGPATKKLKYAVNTADAKDPAWRTAIQERLDTPTDLVGQVGKDIASAAAPPPETQDLTAQLQDLASQINSLRDQVNHMEDRLEKKFEEKLEKGLAAATAILLEQLEERLEKQKEEISDDVEDRLHYHEQEWEVRLDETLLDMKEEAHQRVTEEMQAVEDSIKEDLRNAL